MNWQDDQNQLVQTAIEEADLEMLAALKVSIDGFPNSTDHHGDHWIMHAIWTGAVEAIHWMLAQGTNLKFRADDGYTPLHAAIDSDEANRHEVMQILIDGGADVNIHGLNDWTPLHMAAARDDLDAVEVLMRAGADPTIRTGIDDYATPEEEARILGKVRAADYIRSFSTKRG